MSSGASARYVADHTYSAGTYRVCLTVHDDSGRSVTTCHSVAPGILALQRVREQGDRAEWEICQRSQAFPVTFVALAGEEPVPGVYVTVSGAGPQRSDWTGVDGRISFQLDQSDFQGRGRRAGPPGFALGSVRVRKTRNGWRRNYRKLRRSRRRFLFSISGRMC